MKILIACEESGTVRDAFRKKGHDAISCDILPTSKPGPHYQGYLEDFISSNYDLMIAHPPCTFLCSSGLHWNNRRPEREEKTEYALRFVCMILNSGIKKISLENPVGCISTRIGLINGIWHVLPKGEVIKHPCKPSQIIHPYEFGHNASKSTCLWNFGLPNLLPTEYIAPRIVYGINGRKYERWGNQTDSGQNKEQPGPDRWKIRSKTYQGIADAMADQWG